MSSERDAAGRQDRDRHRRCQRVRRGHRARLRGGGRARGDCRSRTQQGRSARAGSLGPAAVFVRCDVSLRPDIDALVRTCVDQFGAPDIVVNNAGTTHTNMPLLDVDEATFDKVFAVNVKSIYHMVLAVVPLMRKRGSGVILNIGSTAGIRPRPGLTWYNASKGAVNLLSKSLAVELGPDGIRVNAICPCDRRDRPARTIHGHAGYAGESSEVPGDDSARPDVPAFGRCRGGGLSGK